MDAQFGATREIEITLDEPYRREPPPRLNRLKTEPLPTPETELGKHLIAQMDLPTSVINRYTKVVAREVLRKTKPKGKPS